MLDLSRAEKSKNYKSSFDAAADGIISYVDQLRTMYNSIWNESEKNRKQRAALIEEVIKIFKDNGIKTNIPLGKCNNEELNKEVDTVIDDLKLEIKEQVQCNMIKINNRYAEIIRLGKTLNDIMMELSNMRLPEKDFKDEIIVDLKKTKERKNNNTSKVEKKEIPEINISKIEIKAINEQKHSKDDSLIEVIGIKGSGKELNDSLDADLYTKSKKMNQEEILSEDLMDDYVSDAIESILESYQDEKLYSPSSNVSNDEETEFIIYQIKDGESFCDINKKVFDEQIPWEMLYTYGDNRNMIMEVSNQLNKDIEEVIRDKHILKGKSMQIPLEITYDLKEEDLFKKRESKGKLV